MDLIIASERVRCGACGDVIQAGKEYYQHLTGMVECVRCLSSTDEEQDRIVRGSEEDRAAYAWAQVRQGFDGTWEEWLSQPLAERQEYEDGAACGDRGKVVISDAPADR